MQRKMKVKLAVVFVSLAMVLSLFQFGAIHADSPSQDISPFELDVAIDESLVTNELDTLDEALAVETSSSSNALDPEEEDTVTIDASTTIDETVEPDLDE